MDIYPPPAENIYTIRQIHKPPNCKILLEQFETKICIGNRIRTLMQSEALSQVTSMYLQSHIFCVNNMLFLSARPRLYISVLLQTSVFTSCYIVMDLRGEQPHAFHSLCTFTPCLLMSISMYIISEKGD